MKVNLFVSRDIEEPHADIHTNELTDNITKAMSILESEESSDMLAVKNGKKVYIVLMNRNQKTDYEVRVDVENGKIKKTSGNTYTSETPYQPYLWQNMDEVQPYTESEIAVRRNKQYLTVLVPAISYTFMILN